MNHPAAKGSPDSSGDPDLLQHAVSCLRMACSPTGRDFSDLMFPDGLPSGAPFANFSTED